MLSSKIKLWLWRVSRGVLFARWYHIQWWKTFRELVKSEEKTKQIDGEVYYKGVKMSYKNTLDG